MKLSKSLIFILLLGVLSNSLEAQMKIPLWDDDIPFNKEIQVQENYTVSPSGAKIVSNISSPELTAYLLPEGDAKRPSVIICPGGGYAVEAFEHEGNDVAVWLNGLGINAFVLKYRLPDEQIVTQPTWVPLMDVQKAVLLVREHAETWGVDAGNIGVMGFSAGGHLAASAANLFTEPQMPEWASELLKPDFSVLIYPVISMQDELTHKGSRQNLLGISPTAEWVDLFSMEKRVTASTPPTFILHAADDAGVAVQNTEVYAAALESNGVAAKKVILEKGGHGFGMKQNSPASSWIDYLEDWLVKNVL